MDPAIAEQAVPIKAQFPSEEQKNDFNAWKVFWSDLIEDIQRYSEPIHFPALTHLYKLAILFYGSVEPLELDQQVLQESIDAGFIQVTGNLIQNLLKNEATSLKKGGQLFYFIFSIHWNHSDLNKNYCEALCNDKNTLDSIFHFLCDNLEEKNDDDNEKEEEENSNNRLLYILKKSSTNIVANIVRNQPNCHAFFNDKESVFHAFAHMLNVAGEKTQLSACIGLSFITNETHKNIHMECIQALDNVAMKYLLEWKSNSQSGRLQGFSFVEILQGMAMLTKYAIVRNYFYKHRHAINLLTQLFESEREEEILWTVRVIAGLLIVKQEEFQQKQKELFELVDGMREKLKEKSEEFQLVFKEIDNVYG